MKKLLLLAFLLTCTISQAQITRRVEIWEKPMTHEYMTATFNPDSTILISFRARDARYPHLIDYMTLFYGSPGEFYTFLSELELFIKECEKLKDKDLSKDIYGQMVNFTRMYGMTSISIYEKDGRAYGGFLTQALPKFKEKFIAWAEKNNVAYK